MSTQKEKIIEIISRSQNEKDKVLSLDEANTKQTIILPILQALGWDTTNPTEVRCEQKVGSLAVDYALQHADKNWVFLEVKRPVENLDKHEDQILNYSLEEGVPLAVLTNGIEWRFYLPMKPGVPKKERRFLTFNLFKEDKERVTEELFKFLAKENVIRNESQKMAEEELERQQIRKRSIEKLPEAWKELLKEPDPELVKLVSEKVKELFGFLPVEEVIREFLTNIANRTQIYVTDISIPLSSKTDVPKVMIKKNHKKIGTPQSEYWNPVLEVIEEMGGRGKKSEIKNGVYEKMKHKLVPEDYDRLKSTPIERWWDRAGWAILNMQIQGLLTNPERGIWEITDKGREYLRRAKSQS